MNINLSQLNATFKKMQLQNLMKKCTEFYFAINWADVLIIRADIFGSDFLMN
jgi:hypothetical protein